MRFTLKPQLVSMFCYCFLLLSLLGGCADALVNRIAFHPAQNAQSPLPVEPRVDEVFFNSLDGIRLQAFMLGSNSESVILFLHGNAGSVSSRIPHARKLADTGCNVLLLSYRGYGRSEGSASEGGIYQDARAALRYLKRQGFTNQNIFILGRSIGSAAAVEVAGDEQYAGVILISPLSNGKDMARHLGYGPFSWLLGSPFDSTGKISQIETPFLFIHGDSDQIIPIELGKKLFDACQSPHKVFKHVEGAGHNNLISVAGQQYWDWILEFMRTTRGLQQFR